jgi:hypothetical protein
MADDILSAFGAGEKDLPDANQISALLIRPTTDSKPPKSALGLLQLLCTVYHGARDADAPSLQAADDEKALTDLPFVADDTNPAKRRYWKTPPTDDYRHACTVGYEYAACFVQCLKHNPHWVSAGILGWIAKDIDFTDESAAKGYWVGFFSYLERLIHAMAMHIDVCADLERVNAHYAECSAYTTEHGQAKTP